MGNVNTYTNYFRQLAISHKDLKHDPAGETGDCEPGSMHFTKFSVEQVLGKLENSKIGSRLLALELFDNTTESETVNDIRMRPKGSFMILDVPEDKTLAAELACYDKCEAITIDILKQIWQQHYGQGAYGCSTPFKEFDFNKIDITPVGPVFLDKYGYRVVFDFEFQQTIDLTEAPAEGTFE